MHSTDWSWKFSTMSTWSTNGLCLFDRFCRWIIIIKHSALFYQNNIIISSCVDKFMIIQIFELVYEESWSSVVVVKYGHRPTYIYNTEGQFVVFISKVRIYWKKITICSTFIAWSTFFGIWQINHLYLLLRHRYAIHKMYQTWKVLLSCKSRLTD